MLMLQKAVFFESLFILSCQLKLGIGTNLSAKWDILRWNLPWEQEGKFKLEAGWEEAEKMIKMGTGRGKEGEIK